MYLYSPPQYRLKRRESGQGLVEYALILVLVAVVVIVMLALLGDTLNNIFARVADILPTS